MSFEIKRLNESLIPEYLDFFDNIAFCDNPDWSLCYCCHYYLSDDNDVDTREYCQVLIREGKLNGFLAFDGDIPVGWLNCDMITNYPRIMDNFYKDEDKTDTVAAACFVVDHKRRRQGIAKELLAAAMDYYKEAGYKWIEASTKKGAKTDADNYYGPRRLYDNAGFEFAWENDMFYIMRKEL